MGGVKNNDNIKLLKNFNSVFLPINATIIAKYK